MTSVWQGVWSCQRERVARHVVLVPTPTTTLQACTANRRQPLKLFLSFFCLGLLGLGYRFSVLE